MLSESPHGQRLLNDSYQLGHLAYQTDGAGTLLASYTYDSSGAPVSVQVGSDPSSAPRYYYVYTAHGDVVALTDTSGAVVASYAYDTWGVLTSVNEAIPNANGWVNPYRYDGRDGVRSNTAMGLGWLSVRRYTWPEEATTCIPMREQPAEQHPSQWVGPATLAPQ